MNDTYLRNPWAPPPPKPTPATLASKSKARWPAKAEEERSRQRQHKKQQQLQQQQQQQKLPPRLTGVDGSEHPDAVALFQALRHAAAVRALFNPAPCFQPPPIDQPDKFQVAFGFGRLLRGADKVR